jgi:hypothetical protein
MHCTLADLDQVGMKVHLLQRAIFNFLDGQCKSDAVDWYYPHGMINTFQAHWVPPHQETLGDVYDQCLKSDYTQRWWKRDHYRPKEIMLRLIDADAELATIAWKDLFNPDAGLEGRLGRFDFYCDDLLKISRHKHLRSADTYHHQDAAVVSLYLAGRFPGVYTLYPGLEVFQSFCKAIGSPDIPVVDDLVRYMKVAKVVFTFLQKDEQFATLMAQRRNPQHKVPVEPYQLSYELIAFEGTRFNTVSRMPVLTLKIWCSFIPEGQENCWARFITFNRRI